MMKSFVTLASSEWLTSRQCKLVHSWPNIGWQYRSWTTVGPANLRCCHQIIYWLWCLWHKTTSYDLMSMIFLFNQTSRPILSQEVDIVQHAIINLSVGMNAWIAKTLRSASIRYRSDMKSNPHRIWGSLLSGGWCFSEGSAWSFAGRCSTGRRSSLPHTSTWFE